MKSSRKTGKKITVLMAAFVLAAFLSSCGIIRDESGSSQDDAQADENTLIIGVVVPQSGEYSDYSRGTEYILEILAAAYNEETGQDVRFIVKDSESSSKAAEEAAQSLADEGADIIIAAHGDETCKAVSAACERLGILCIAADCDLDSWLGSGPYDYSFCISWNMESRLYALTANWDSVSDAPVVGILVPADSDADGILDIYDDIAYDTGATIIDPGRYTEGQTDYSSIISAFETSGCEIITGIMDPDDFAMFIKQADEAGYYPEIIAVADACIFESDMLSLYELSDGLYTDVSWSVSYGSSEAYLITSQDIEDIFEENYGISAPQSAGLFAAAAEAALDIAARAGSFEADALTAAADGAETETVLGTLSFDEDGACLISTGLGMWTYDSDTDSCSLEIIEEESEDSEDE